MQRTQAFRVSTTLQAFRFIAYRHHGNNAVVRLGFALAFIRLSYLSHNKVQKS